ncbi:TIR domain-containing adapter molecule 1 [Oncorhynchus mykiss]|uniref:TIR domain-containing adapter molecule 1 n=1 Tax=Oncorhynchus mykiss TaxID=8022 RepID=UPI000B4EB9C0|nr:TIR domain-containing adapter molecule 1 [Oncorhynchus mykiss]XP_036825176.1 TIR domain-containing adapter molecule 1 [Oncorhynchus mykiss]XP_036825177.1 TIR domain-containing adapter molecule 1 [Oncorhynchus mykiss]XP_036825178.1 TIR domain-containing adapter molecule 1 [Oncorhynchus mykiss]XP_036825179.1 TIR domain-containing adapter molecule 1 [Oncorhynchus mykiss]
MLEMDREAHAEDEPRGGTGLVDAFKILSKVPYERQLSLTFKLGDSLAEELVHAMSLIRLGKRSEALNKLQALGDNNIIANHLAEKVRMCGVKLEDLTVSMVPFQECTVGTLADLARIFKVLAEERLCDSSLRDLAYQTALATFKNKNSGEESSESEYIQMQLREEANRVCGPQIEDTVGGMCFPKDSSSGLCSIPTLDQGSTALQKPGFPNQTGSSHSPPSSLRDDTSICSYPSHLEISVSETVGFKTSNIPSQPPPMNLEPVQSPVPHYGTNTGDEGAFKYFSRVTSQDIPPTQDVPKPVKGEMDRVTSVAVSCEHRTGSEVRVSPLSPVNFTPVQTKFDKPESPNAHSKPCPKNNLVPPSNNNRPTSHPTTTEPVSASVPLKTPNQEEEEEEVFFSFVILHAAEDVDMAEKFKEELESIVGGEGATFSQDFAIPGRNTLMCVEDAINNSAFTILMLTRNFNTRLLEVETSSVLMNAIENLHKYNTVIPFLPQENRMPRENMPKVLRIFIPLEEGNAFERKAKRAMAPARIAKQRRLWLSEQAVRAQVRRQERLRLEERLQMDLIRGQETERMQRYLLQQQLSNQPSTPAMPHFTTAPFLGSTPINVSNMSVTPPQRGWSHPPGNIHIQNARYIMFGNDSKMTVGQGGDSSGDEEDRF